MQDTSSTGIVCKHCAAYMVVIGRDGYIALVKCPKCNSTRVAVIAEDRCPTCSD